MKRKIIKILFVLLILTALAIVFIEKDNSVYDKHLKGNKDSEKQFSDHEQSQIRRYMFDYDYSMSTLNEILDDYFKEHDLNEDNFALSYYNFDNKEYFHFNEKKMMFAASTYKLPLNMYYYELRDIGKYDGDSLLYYGEDSIEEGYAEIQNYALYDYIPLDILQYQSIVSSDNNASWVLFNNLGGWGQMKLLIQKYANKTDNMNSSIDEANYFTSSYMLDVLTYLETNKDKFTLLIEHMGIGERESYLRKYMEGVNVIHKYGQYESACNDVGIVYADSTYALAIFSDGLIDGEKTIGEINRIIYEFVQTHNESLS